MMHHKKLPYLLLAFTLVFTFALFTVSKIENSKAEAMYGSFGGTVVADSSTLAAIVTCPDNTVGPFTTSYENIAAGPYFVGLSGQNPIIGDQVLGNYDIIPISTCVSTTTGAPLPAYQISNFGVAN